MGFPLNLDKNEEWIVDTSKKIFNEKNKETVVKRIIREFKKSQSFKEGVAKLMKNEE